MKKVHNIYNNLIKIENVLQAWHIFQSGKADKIEVARFRHNLEDNLFNLFNDLMAGKYEHGGYEKFSITDPKVRVIHKATIRDRITHTLAAKELEKIYQPVFIANSYACQKGRGIHKALMDLAVMGRKLSKNNINNFWLIKCDIKKFFDNIDHGVLLKILERKIGDKRFLNLLKTIIFSYCLKPHKGLPLGNYTSQWLANIYLNDLDYFIKHKLRIKYYLRYSDDFIIMAENSQYLLNILNTVKLFLRDELHLHLHADKIKLQKYSSGIDFVGYKVLPHYILIRKRIKNRVLKRLTTRIDYLLSSEISNYSYYQSLNSYLGWLKHAKGYKLASKIIYNYI